MDVDILRVVRANVTAYVSDDVYDWPGHRQEIIDKVNELDELIHSLETGQTERMADSEPTITRATGFMGPFRRRRR